MQGGKIDLSGHIAKIKYATIFKSCKQLFANTDIDYFCYLRRYRDGHFTFLPSMIDFGSYLFEDAAYPDTWFAGIPFEGLKSGYSFWEIAKQVSSQETNAISIELAQSFKLSAGIEILDKYDDYCDFYSFSGNSPSIYFLPANYLYQFIFYFKQECHTLILDAYNSTLSLPAEELSLSPIPIIPQAMQSIAGQGEFDIKRYYLEGKYSGTFLTKREVDILRRLERGGTVKCLADELCISPRTLEHHITNVKDKLNISHITELLHVARLNKIIF